MSLRYAPALTVALMLGPVLAGLLGTLAPAFGYFPALGRGELNLDPFRHLAGWPGLGAAMRLSVTTGLAATALSLGLTALILAAWHGTRGFRWMERALSPLLSVPHAAAAFGIAFLIAPSGWIARALSPWATGWETPPDLLILQDPWGIAMTLGLVVKELPFLLLMSLAALPQLRPQDSLRVAHSLGYGRVRGWMLTVFPRLYALIRLPVYAVLAYSMTVVDVAIILGPNTPPPLSVQVVRWMSDPDLQLRLPAAAAALVQLGLVGLVLLLWRGGELALSRAGRRMAGSGARGSGDGIWRLAALAAAGLSVLLVFLGLAGLGLWSVAGFWRFPDALPDAVTLKTWMRHGGGALPVLATTLLIALWATAIALILTLACLEAERRLGLRMGRLGSLMLYLPLLVPQIAFLPGLQTLALITGADLSLTSVVLAHTVFVIPYVFLSLGDPYRRMDPRFDRVAAALGASDRRSFWHLRLPLMLGPVLTAAAIGIAVSVGQYLPTLLIGAGRIQTLTTEAVALAAGGNRRIIGIYALLQTGTVIACFALALLLPRLIWARRRDMRGAA